MVWASALRAEGRGFDSRGGTFPDFFCQGICCAGVDLCSFHINTSSVMSGKSSNFIHLF